MSQEEILNSVYQEDQYNISLHDADTVISTVSDKEKAKRKEAISKMIARINDKVDDFYVKNGWVALSVGIPMTDEVSKNPEYIREVKDCLVAMNWNVRVEDKGELSSNKEFVIKPRNWFTNKKDQHGKRGKQKPSFLTTFGVIIIAAIIVGAFIKG